MPHDINLGQVRVTEDQPGGRVQPPQGAIDELGKGVMIASLRPADQLSPIHDRLAWGSARVVVLNRVWRRCLPKRSSGLRSGLLGAGGFGSNDNRPVRIGLPESRSTAIALSVAVFAIPLAFALLVPHPLEQPFGVDFVLYRDAAARWLAGGPYFEAYQLAGPYDIRAGDVLYPPVGLLLFVPFAVLPDALAWPLWWGIPLTATAWALWRLQPRPAVWPLLALCVAWPTTLLKTWTGNPVIWCVAALALGTLWYWPSVFVLLKPSLAPFALFGASRRRWWIALAVFVLLCLPFGSLWLDWVASVVNSRGGGPLYSTLEIPMLLFPLVAWLGRRAAPDGRAIVEVEA